MAEKKKPVEGERRSSRTLLVSAEYPTPSAPTSHHMVLIKMDAAESSVGTKAADSIDKKATDFPTNPAMGSAEEKLAPSQSNDNGDDFEEPPDEEDDFFKTIEAQQAKDEAEHANDAQPNQATSAPKLLQDAIKKGEVNVDESEAESEANRKLDDTKGRLKSEGLETVNEEKKDDDGGQQPHVHHRVSARKIPCVIGAPLLGT